MFQSALSLIYSQTKKISKSGSVKYLIELVGSYSFTLTSVGRALRMLYHKHDFVPHYILMMFTIALSTIA